MTDYSSLNHTKWECKYHVVFIPKYRKKRIFGEIRRHLGRIAEAGRAAESRIEEGHLMPDHVHMMISIPPKYSVAQVIGYIKGKSAIHIARSSQAGSGTSWASTSGRVDTSYRRWVVTKR